jgi:aminoglycoside phosphotransferase (APT) family kinase protein
VGNTFLSQSDVVPYLVEEGVLKNSAIADRRLRVVDASRRNQVFVVTSEHSPAYVVKQPRTRDDLAVAREAAVLCALRALDAPGGLGPFLPAVITYDVRRQVLVLRTEAGARDLRQHYARGRFSIALARASGRALALLHSLPPDVVGARPAGLDPTWLLSWHRPSLEQLFELSATSVELLRLAQGSTALCDGLDELCDSLLAESLIHGDVRWDNWIALRTPASPRRSRLVIVDWELAGEGDPCFDIGAFFAEYLLAWLASIPVIDIQDPSWQLRHARYPLHRMRPSLREFWIAYLTTSRKRAEGGSLRRAVRFAAVRLLQAAAEQARDGSKLRAHTILLLQLAVNLLTRPDIAAERVLGLPVHTTES